MKKAVIFDMDGVLVGTPKYSCQSNNVALEKYGVRVEKEDHKPFQGKSLALRVPLYEQKFSIKINFEEFSSTFNQVQLGLVKSEIDESKKEIQQLIFQLKQKGLKIAIATSARKEKAYQIVEWLGITNQLDSFLTADDLSKHKPHPEPYLKTLDKLNMNPEDGIVIEDSPLGIQAGKSAGITVLALKTDEFTNKELSESDYIINNLEEILNYLD